jgi:hypothetical protein
MKSITIKLAGLCLVAMFAVSLVASATASAGVWEQCTTEKTTVTKYTTDLCTVASSTGIWGWKALGTTEKVLSSATLTLRDTSTAVGLVEVKCTGTDEGSIGPTKYDLVTKVTVVGCVKGTGCEEWKRAAAVHLPWQTELFQTEGRVRNKITGTGAGEPGWEVECKVLFFPVTDECTSETGTTLMENVQTRGTVQAVFETKSGKAKCTQSTLGNKLSGEVLGVNTLWSVTGQAIKVS